MASTLKHYYVNSINKFNTLKLSTNVNDDKYTIGCLDNTIYDGTPDITYGAIVFIKDTQQIWTHGELYGGDIEQIEEDISELSEKIDNISWSRNYILSNQESYNSISNTENTISIDNNNSSYDSDNNSSVFYNNKDFLIYIPRSGKYSIQINITKSNTNLSFYLYINDTKIDTVYNAPCLINIDSIEVESNTGITIKFDNSVWISNIYISEEKKIPTKVSELENDLGYSIVTIDSSNENIIIN